MRLVIYSRLSIILLSVLLTSCLVSDSDSPAPEDLFVKYYGGIGTETIEDIGYISSTDEYIVLANSNSDDTFNAGLNDIFLFKTSNDGAIIEERFLDFSNGSDSANDIASGLKIMNDNILVIGTTEVRQNDLGVFGNKSAFYLFYDFNLNELSKGTISKSGVDVVGNDIIRTDDGNYVILSTVGDDLSGQRNIMYTKITPTGAVVWERTNNLPGDDLGVSLIELANGNIAICAKTERVSVRGFLGFNILYLVINPLGFINNSLSYGTELENSNIVDDIPTKMIKDGLGAVIVGSSVINETEKPFILPLTSSGAIDDIRVIEIEGHTGGARFNDIRRARNGDFILTGDFVDFINTSNQQDSGNKRQEALFLRTNQFGTISLSVNNFGDNFDESGKAINELPDGKILIGATVSFGGSNTKIGLFKVNRNGQLLKLE